MRTSTAMMRTVAILYFAELNSMAKNPYIHQRETQNGDQGIARGSSSLDTWPGKGQWWTSEALKFDPFRKPEFSLEIARKPK